MKFLFIALACYVASSDATLSKDFVEKFKEKMLGIASECVKETGANEEDVAELKGHTLPPSTHEGKCMLFCANKHLGIMKEDGSIDQEGAIKSLDPLKEEDEEIYDKVLKIFTTCGTNAVIDSDPCITSTMLAECAKKEGEKVGLTHELLDV